MDLESYGPEELAQLADFARTTEGQEILNHYLSRILLEELLPSVSQPAPVGAPGFNNYRMIRPAPNSLL